MMHRDINATNLMNLLTISCYSAPVTNINWRTKMRSILLAPIWLFIFLILIACMCGNSHASQGLTITFDNPPMDRTERIIKGIVDRNRGINLKVQEKQYIYNDDESELRRDGYIALPKKPNGEEHYVGR